MVQSGMVTVVFNQRLDLLNSMLTDSDILSENGIKHNFISYKPRFSLHNGGLGLFCKRNWN